VLLRDVNENPTVISSFFEVPENYPITAIVGKVATVDVDAGQVVFTSIISGNANDAFRMNRDGSIYVMEDGILNFEEYERQHFKIVIRGRDTGKGALIHENTITINVTNVNEPPWFPEDHSYARQIKEGSITGEKAGDILPSGDDDIGDTRTFTVDVGLGNGYMQFGLFSKIQPYLILLPGYTLDFEKQQEYTVYVRATDTGGLSSNVAVRVEIL
jgi:hypothetical protein